MRRILITGPESTGKSELSTALAAKYGGVAIPEFARGYIENLERPYQYGDIEQIAEIQYKEYATLSEDYTWVFFDTWLMITKVWFEVVYTKVPNWIEERLRQASFDLVLLCDTDLPWIADPVRENGGENRERLLDHYKRELEKLGLDWALVSGVGPERMIRASQLINKKMNNGIS